uniref:EGF-like domain-containing protein n=1 Tax=Panagrolaimus davidi TaxID=227884 RepID=A0A914P8R3_9BILA
MVQRPCDENPCKNNGTCRTTRSLPAFFCECPTEWGGQHCELEVPQTAPLKYGKNVNMVSSGQPDWIEELKRRQYKPKTELPSIKTAKDMHKHVKLNDEPIDGSGNISSAENMKNGNSTSAETENVEHSEHSGVFTVHEKSAISAAGIPTTKYYFCFSMPLFLAFLALF